MPSAPLADLSRSSSFGALYTPRGYLQQPASIAREWPGHFRMERLRPRQSNQTDDLGRGGVHAAFSAPRPAPWFCAHLAIRLSGESGAQTEIGPVPLSVGTLPPDQSARTDSPADGNCKTEQQPRHCPACKAGWLVAIGVFRPGEMVSLEAVAPVTRAGSPGHLMTVPLTNLLPNSAAFSAGTGDLCPDSKLRAPECQCRSLKRALPVAHSPLLACRHFHYQQPALPAPSRQFEKPFKPHK